MENSRRSSVVGQDYGVFARRTFWDLLDMDDTRIRFFWLMFGSLVVVGVGLFFVPAFIIRPFRYQSPSALQTALIFRQMAPIGTILAACAVLALVAWYWKGAGWVQRSVLALGGLLVIGSATMARMNYFEWMFHPVAQPGFEKAGDVKLDVGEMVLALDFNGEARAYPIREMAYHHIVNDVVGGVPVAITY
jgi:hypothetical protein